MSNSKNDNRSDLEVYLDSINKEVVEEKVRDRETGEKYTKKYMRDVKEESENK